MCIQSSGQSNEIKSQYEFMSGNTKVGVSVYKEDVLRILIGEGKYPKSGAILPSPRQETLESGSETVCAGADCAGADCVEDYDAQQTAVWIWEDDMAHYLKTAELTLCVQKEYFDLAFYDKNGTLLSKTYPGEGYFRAGVADVSEPGVSESGEADCTGVRDSGFCLKFLLNDKEHLYGLGEDNNIAYGRLDRRGTVRSMFTGQQINQNHVTADFPIPFLLSAGGEAPYGFYMDNTYQLTVDMGKSVKDKLSIEAKGGACLFYVIGGESPAKVVENFSSMTGHAKLPPLWVLGFMQCRCSFWEWEEIEDAILSFEKHHIPLDSIVFDFDWAQYFNNYKWNDRWQGKSPEKIAYYRENYGIHFMASNSGPMLKKDSDTFEDALNAGVLARDSKGNTVTCGHYSGELIDFTNPKTEAFMEPQIRRIMQDGIESWWLDLTEPEEEAEDTIFHAGSRAEVHNVFSNAVSRTYHNVMQKENPGKRSFVLTRTGTAGIQNNPTALWSGDVYSEYGTLLAHIPEAMNTQLSGISMWTCDTGGFLSPSNNSACPHNLYHNDPVEHALLYERWMQFSCFTPMFRAHHAGEAVPFRYQDIAVDGMARYIRLRYKLIPYIYALYYQCYKQGTPIMRPLFYHYPEDERAHEIKDEYLFGESLLVAPVVEPNAKERRVYLPEGLWYDMDYRYAYEGGRDYVVYAPQNRIPVFVKAGALIPTTDMILNTRELDWSGLEMEVYPHGTSETTIYADDGYTDAYVQGEYTETRVLCEEKEEGITLQIEANNDKFPLKELMLRIHMKKRGCAVRINGQSVAQVSRKMTVERAEHNAFWFDEFKRMLYVKLYLPKTCENGTTGHAEENCVEAAKASSSVQVEILTTGDDFQPWEPFREEKITGQLPYIFPPAAIPGKLQGIRYDRGGEGVAFHKHTPVLRTEYRDDNAGICITEQGYVVELSAGEWLEYTISCAKKGDYRVKVSGNLENAKIKVGVGKKTVAGVFEEGGVGKSVFTELTDGETTLPIMPGEQIFHIECVSGEAKMGDIIIFS